MHYKKRKFIFRWGNTPERAARKGQCCFIIEKAAPGSEDWKKVTVRFSDGELLETSLRALISANKAQKQRTKQLGLFN